MPQICPSERSEESSLRWLCIMKGQNSSDTQIIIVQCGGHNNG